MTNKTILITGGAGYIGSHTSVELIQKGYKVIIVDNYLNSSKKAIDRIKEITNTDFDFYDIDLCDKEQLMRVFLKHKFNSVIHFAGLKAVGESVEKPLLYYKNNLVGSINLFDLMVENKVNELVFSSSACVYGEPKKTPITEDFPIQPLNPYGQTKVMIEQIIKDLSLSNKFFKTIILRYFNPVGAHKSGMLGEDPNGIPNNLVPFVSKVAMGQIDKLKVFGNDYDTKDGTAVRDYIHVLDLAEAHIKALDRIKNIDNFEIYNLGTGKGTTVLEVVAAFEEASGKKIPYEIVGRRVGDAESVFTDPSLANKNLNWFAKKEILEMCKDVWNWQIKNPNGFK